MKKKTPSKRVLQLISVKNISPLWAGLQKFPLHKTLVATCGCIP